jgi:hypothetical protein
MKDVATSRGREEVDYLERVTTSGRQEEKADCLEKLTTSRG